ncbi:GlxA family transcriptional regulator [Epibacterium ulvae]|uniref:GlxA family transcriptional regulator n=1 Tax=Epibacterium ulvae TaxID=1156985 RepID=UPI002491BEA5|nr:helix-turn-helix domain-containing protein [Epibacterium ulvae]
MPIWKKQSAAAQQMDILLFDAFSLQCLANVVEPMRAANKLAQQTLYKWRVLTLTGASVCSSSDMEIHAQGQLSEAAGDTLFVMPSYGFADLSTSGTHRALRAAERRYTCLAGLDTGAWLLAGAGLLDGYRATLHFDEFERFSETFPKVSAQRHRKVLDRNRITCSGALAAFELMLDLIGQTHGQALRLDVSALFMGAEQTGPESAARIYSTNTSRVIELMQRNLETPLPLSVLSQRLGLSQKELERRIKTELGIPPRTLYRHLRLSQAHRLLMTQDLSIAEIALRSGYENASAFTRAFRLAYHTTPRALRKGR